MINITERAAKKAIQIAHKEGRSPAVIRLGVRGGGCSGLSYFFEFTQAPGPRDEVWVAFDLTCVCDPKSAQLLQDSVFDFDPNLLRGGFKFNNPKAKRSCSCGESFAV